jgi:CheY-like chemotaxis protein
MYFDPVIYIWTNYTILIVEDDISSTFFLKEVLKETGVTVFHAADGKQAIEICRENPGIDLILMDIRMPVMDGLIATREIRKFRPELPIIAQTANAMYDTRMLCQEAGCNDYITKPLDSVELLQKISVFLT